MSCELCTDPDGAACFPLYGLGPHTHDANGRTVLDADQTAPGFTPSAKEPGYGIWWCPACGDGRPDPAKDRP